MNLLGPILTALGVMLFVPSLLGFLRQVERLRARIEIYGAVDYAIRTRLHGTLTATCTAFASELSEQQRSDVELVKQCELSEAHH